MATVTDVEVANASFPTVRQDLNDILEAIATNFSADAEPTTTYANQFWYETDTNLLKMRNEANDTWITLAYLDQASDEWEIRSAVMQAVDAAGLAFKTDEGTTRLSISDAGQVSFQNYSFPTADGSSGQVLTTNGSGVLSFASAPSGKVLQVVAANDILTATNTNSTSFVATTLAATITPTSASSKILVIATFSATQDGGSNIQSSATIYRGGSNLRASGTPMFMYDHAGGNVGFSGTFMFYDSPATTVATTYTVYVKVANSSSFFRAVAGTDTITLMEIE